MWSEAKRLAIGCALAVAVTATPGTAQTLTAVEDAFVNSEQDTLNFGNLSFVEVGRDGPPKFGVDRGLLQFDSSPLPSSPVMAATLRIFVTDTAFDPLNLSITIASLASTFDESTVTWITQPPVSGQTTSTVMNAMAGEFFDIDVTSLVAAQLAAHPSFIGLRVAATDETLEDERWFDFSSKESPEGGAQLLVSFAAPAPVLAPRVLVLAVALLMVIGALTLRAARRSHGSHGERRISV